MHSRQAAAPRVGWLTWTGPMCPYRSGTSSHSSAPRAMNWAYVTPCIHRPLRWARAPSAAALESSRCTLLDLGRPRRRSRRRPGAVEQGHLLVHRLSRAGVPQSRQVHRYPATGRLPPCSATVANTAMRAPVAPTPGQLTLIFGPVRIGCVSNWPCQPDRPRSRPAGGLVHFALHGPVPS